MTNGAAIAAGLTGQPATNVQPARVFIGVRVADEIARALAELARPLEQHGVRLVPRGDIHLTLIPPWNENQVAGAIEKLRNAVGEFRCFSLTFAHLEYGPTLRYPRLLWVDCEANDELNNLRTALLTAYGQVDSRPFLPHVTLARIPINGRTIARQNPMDQTLALTQCVTSVELFQSPPKGQRGYQVLASLPLGAQPHPEATQLP
ncbi:MAG: RNA 2',3'-cyclic phosphodiesterase [Beijerinckiaceae bacterium]